LGGARTRGNEKYPRVEDNVDAVQSFAYRCGKSKSDHRKTV